MSRYKFTIEQDMAKAAEIEILTKLQRIYKSFPDNYLASLFSDEFVGWASNRIRDDIMVDAYEYIRDFHENPEADQLKEEVQDKENIIKAVKVVLEDREQTITELKEKLAKREESVLKLDEYLHDAREQVFRPGPRNSGTQGKTL